MAHQKTSRRSKSRTMLRLADLEQSKCGSPLARRSELARIIRSCHRRVYRVVLLRLAPAAFLQPPATDAVN